MNLVPFSPPPGINSDDTTFAAEGRWADGNNVRFRGGKAQVVGGWDDEASSNTFTGNARVIIGWTANNTFDWVAVATTSAVYIGQYGIGGTGIVAGWDDVSTPSAIDNFSTRVWSFAMFGDTLLANGYSSGGSGSHDNSLWNATNATTSYNDLASITQAPAQTTWILVPDKQRQVIALGCNEETSGTFNPRCIRWCDFEDYTDWTSTSTNNAGEQILTGAGEIVCGRVVGPYIAVLTNKDLWLGEYIGDPLQTYRFTQQADNCGVASPYSAEVVDGVLYWMGVDRQLRRWAPGARLEIVPCPIYKAFRDNDYKITEVPVANFLNHTGYNPKFNEIWHFYADSRDSGGTPTTATRYVAYSITENVWFRGELVRTAWAVNHVSEPWGAATNGKLMRHEIGVSDNGSAMAWHIQSADQYIDESKTRAMIKGVIPDFEDQGATVNLTLYVRNRPQSSATTKGPYALTTALNKKDFRASGKIFAIRWEDSDAVSGFMRLGKPLFDVVTMGER